MTLSLGRVPAGVFRALRWKHPGSGRCFLSKRQCINKSSADGRLVGCKRTSNKSAGSALEDGGEREDEELIYDPQYREYLKEYYSIPEAGHRVLVIQPANKSGSRRFSLTTPELQLAESCSLIETLPKWKVVGKRIVFTKNPQTSLVFGKGNISELAELISFDTKGITAVFISISILTGIQWSTLQKAWDVPVYDRYTVVLQIFNNHAKTKESKLQIALAEIPYIRSRMRSVHEGTADRATGGTRYIGGSGETYLDIRYRLLQNREIKLKKALEKVKNQRELLRKSRLKRQIPIIAVVGYTNSGKTTLIKALTGDADLQPMDHLFATLDVTAHAGVLSNKMAVIYMDTVGFMSDIPLTLIDAFAATLEDALIADVLVHVRDISRADTQAQQRSVLSTLESLASGKQLGGMIEVCNKVDLLTGGEDAKDSSALYTDASTGYGVELLKEQIQHAVLLKTAWKHRRFRIPMNSTYLGWLYKEATVTKMTPDADSVNLVVDVIITDAVYSKFKAYFKKQINSENEDTA